MWVAVTSPGTELDAADRGIGCLGVTFSFAEQEAKVKEYRRRVQNCNPVGSFVNDQVATVNFLYCHADNETGAKTGMNMAISITWRLSSIWQKRRIPPSPTRPRVCCLPCGVRRPAPATSEGIAVGNPEHLIGELKKWESSGVDRVNFLLNAAEIIPQAQVLDSLRLFATEVMPTFADSQPQYAAAGGAS